MKNLHHLILTIALGFAFNGQAQMNPAVSNPFLIPNPLTDIGSEFDLSFSVGNNGTIGISGADDFNRMRFDFTLGKSKPSVGGAISTIGTDALSGTALSKFTITYNSANNTFTGIQNAPLSGPEMLAFSVHAQVTVLSSKAAAAEIGGSVDISPSVMAQANNQTEVDDQISIFTATTFTLPATGLRLKAILGGEGRVVLNWETLTEASTSYFNVEKSADGASFLPVGKVWAAGNSNTVKSYQFTDPLLLDKPAYFRIRLFDLDGRSKTSNIEILTVNAAATVCLFPNPARQFVTVTGLRQGQKIMFFDNKGSQLSELAVKASAERISLAGFTAGTYVMAVYENGKIITTKNLIKQ